MWYNSIVAGVLNSPLHGVMSGSMMLITFQGRQSGKTYSTPVEYIKVGEELSVVSRRERTWWRNLIGCDGKGAPLTLHLQGQDVNANARVVMQEAELTRELDALCHARPAYAKYLKMRLDAQGQPVADDLTRAARQYVIVRVRPDKTG